MCGFSGYLNFNFNISKLEQKKVIDASNNLSHRGPDKTINFINDNLCAVFHRLSIIDLSHHSDQPFNKDKDLVLLFNGEIYNYKELIFQFKNKISMNSLSDTELIYELYKIEGKNFFKYLKGMFSIVLIDFKNNISYFVRDDEGIKPLYFSSYKGGIFFSSELRFFRKLGINDINNLQIFSFLYLGFTIEPETYLRNVYSLNKAKYLMYDKVEKYYFKDVKKLNPINSKYDVSTNLSKNILKHAVSDVDGTILFSGGYDSYFILKTFLDTNKLNRVNSLTNINFFNTNIFDNMNTKLFKEKLKKSEFNYRFPFYTFDNFIKDTELFLEKMDQPTIDGINTYILTKNVKEIGYKYAISGLGADELFDGYNLMRKYNIMKFLSLINKNIPNSLKQILSKKLFKNNKKILSTLSNSNLDNYLTLRSLRTDYELNEIYQISELKSLKDKLIDFIQDNYQFNSTNLRNNFLSMDKELYMTNQLLKNTDWISMLNSVEVRVPYIFDNFHERLYNSNFSYSKKDTIGVGYENFYQKKYKKFGFSFPIKEYLERKNLSVNGNPMKKWSLVVLDQSFGISI